MTNTWDAANRLTTVERVAHLVAPIYNGVGDRVGQAEGGNTTDFALDVVGLSEVIRTSEGNSYLHLPGVIVAESAAGETRYLLSDGLGSVRQAIDETGAVVNYNEFDPYGNPVQYGSNPYGYTGEWWNSEVGLLHLRARWYLPETGTFLSRDPWAGNILWSQTLNGWSYVENNPTNLIDPSGYCPPSICRDEYGPFDPYYRQCAYWDMDCVLRNKSPQSFQKPDIESPFPPPLVPNGANGYVEGKVSIFSAVGCVWTIVGEEIVYDFQSRQRQKFTYTRGPVPGLAFSIWGGSKAAYGGFLWGFTGDGVVNDYKGYFVGTSLGVNASIFKKLGFNAGPGIGWGQFSGTGDRPFGAVTGGPGIISGDVVYFSLNASTDIKLLGKSRLRFLPVDASASGTLYTAVKGRAIDRYRGREFDMLEDVRNADDSPIRHVPLIFNGFSDPNIRNMGAKVGAATFVKNGWIAPDEW
jgi:RHS repeat-associated protein